MSDHGQIEFVHLEQTKKSRVWKREREREREREKESTDRESQQEKFSLTENFSYAAVMTGLGLVDKSYNSGTRLFHWVATPSAAYAGKAKTENCRLCTDNDFGLVQTQISSSGEGHHHHFLWSSIINGANLISPLLSPTFPPINLKILKKFNFIQQQLSNELIKFKPTS